MDNQNNNIRNGNINKVKIEDITSLGLGSDLEKEIRDIQNAGAGDINNYPSSFRAIIQYYRGDPGSSSKYGEIEDLKGNSLLTLYYFNPLLFKNTVMEYTEGLQNQIFKLRSKKEGAKKYMSLEYWNSVNGMFEIFEHLIKYTEENGLDADLLNYPDYNRLESMKKDLLSILKVAHNVSGLYSAYIKFYMDLKDKHKILSAHERSFYKKPEEFVGFLRNFNEKARKVLENKNHDAIKLNKPKFDSLNKFLNSIPMYEHAFLGHRLSGKELKAIVKETKDLLENLFKKHDSLVSQEVIVGIPDSKKGKFSNGIRIEMKKEEDYPDSPGLLLDSLSKLNYPIQLGFDGRTTRGVRVYANRLCSLADSLLEFKSSNPNIDLSIIFEEVKKIETDLNADTLFGQILINGELDPKAINYHLGGICRFLKEEIKKADINASSKDEDSLELITQEEYEKVINDATPIPILWNVNHDHLVNGK